MTNDEGLNDERSSNAKTPNGDESDRESCVVSARLRNQYPARVRPATVLSDSAHARGLGDTHPPARPSEPCSPIELLRRYGDAPSEDWCTDRLPPDCRDTSRTPGGRRNRPP